MSFVDEMMAIAFAAEPKELSQPLTAAPLTEVTFELPKSVGLTSWTEGYEKRLKAKFPNPVEEWNKRDFVKYMAHVYYENTGSRYSYRWGPNYAALGDIQDKLKAQTKFDASNQLTKDYIDFAFQKYVVPQLARGKKFDYFMFHNSDAPFIDFVSHLVKNKPEPVVVENKTEKITLEKMNAAHEIHSRFFVKTYGPVVYANYLLKFQNYTMEQMLKVVVNAINKAVSQSEDTKEEIVGAMEKYAPCAKYLLFVDVKKFGFSWLKELPTSDDNHLLSVFSNSSGKPTPF